MRAEGRSGVASAAAFFEAITAGDQERVRSMLDDAPGLVHAADEQGLAPLIVATYWRRPAVVDLLLGRGAPDDVFAAAARGDVLAVEVLLDAEPNAINHFSVDGWTPLALAAHYGSVEVAQHLLASGAEVKVVSRNALANTSVHAAVAGNQPEIVDLLLSYGADPNATDANGWTPLNLAAHAGYVALVRRLLDAGADATIANHEKRTPLDVALQQGHDAVVAELDERVESEGG
ncbi:MAG: ankyrin repeat domain-containing protein [Thermomicrobiales bacterium]